MLQSFPVLQDREGGPAQGILHFGFDLVSAQ